MKAKLPVAAVLGLALASGSVQAQGPYSRPALERSTVAAEPVPEQAAEPAPSSRWLTPTPCLCDTPGQSSPIGSEFYVQTGASIPVNSCFNVRDALGRDMRPGFVVQSGVRSLFFNPPADRAWVVDASLSHQSNGNDPFAGYALRVIDFTGNTDPLTGQPEVKLIQFGTPTKPFIHIRDTDRTYANLAIGHDRWWWRSSAETEGWHLRTGWNIGGRYGTLSQEYDIIKHRTDVIGGFFVGWHTEAEFPTAAGIFLIGARGEWAYTWSDILQRGSDINEINVMMTMGWRF